MIPLIRNPLEKTMKFSCLALSALTLAIPVFAQNDWHVIDKTTESTSRGGVAGANAAGLYVRMPADQYLGGIGIMNTVSILQDQNIATADPVMFVVRGNDPVGPATGQPDITGAGLLASAGPFNLSFGTGTGAAAAYWTITWTTTPATAIRVPTTANPGNPPSFVGLDMYSGVECGVNVTPGVAWPTDGVSMHCSLTVAPTNPGEQMSPLTVGYTGVAGNSGMGWRWDATTPGALPIVASGNRAWWINNRMAGNVLRTFADNAGAFTGVNSGANPNYGYAGMFLDEGRTVASVVTPDNLGFRLHATNAMGSPVYFFISSGIIPPIAIAGVGGELALDISSPVFGEIFSSLPSLPIGVTGAMGTPFGQPYAATSTECVFGPLPGSSTLIGLPPLSFQAVTVDAITSVFTISSVCTVRL